MKNEIVLFETDDREIKLDVLLEKETIWLNRNQMASLFGRDVKTIGKHINNALKEELDGQVVVAKFATTTCPHGAIIVFGVSGEKPWIISQWSEANRRWGTGGNYAYDCGIQSGRKRYHGETGHESVGNISL